MLYTIFFTIIMINVILIFATYIRRQVISKILLCVCAALAVIMMILMDNHIGATEHYDEVKLLPNGQYCEVILTKSIRGLHRSSFVTINENKEEVIWKCANPEPEIIYIDDYTAYAKFVSYDKIIEDVTLYLPDPHCKSCREKQLTYTTYCGDCGKKMWYAN